MEISKQDLGDIVAILERMEGKLFGPDAVRKIDAFIKTAIPREGDNNDGMAGEAVAAAFEALALSRDTHPIEVCSVIASVDPVRRSFAVADWQVGRPVALAPEPSDDAHPGIRCIVADAPTAFLSGGKVVVERRHDRLLIEIPSVAEPVTPGAHARLWPSVAGRAPAPAERHLLRDRLASTHWMTEDSEAFLPAAIAPLLPPVRNQDLDTLYRAVLPIPAELLERERTGGGGARFSLDWPYGDTPEFATNPILLRRLPADGARAQYEAISNAEGVAVVSLPPPDLRAHKPRRVVGIAVRHSDTTDCWHPCHRRGTANASAPSWAHDPMGNEITIENLEPDRGYLVDLVISEPGTARIVRGTAWRDRDNRVSISVLGLPGSPSLRDHSTAHDGVEASTVVSLGDLKSLLHEVDPFGVSLLLDPETLSVKRMLALTESGLALTLDMTIVARAENREPADLARCSTMLGALLDRLIPIPVPSIVTIGGIR